MTYLATELSLSGPTAILTQVFLLINFEFNISINMFLPTKFLRPENYSSVASSIPKENEHIDLCIAFKIVSSPKLLCPMLLH